MDSVNSMDRGSMNSMNRGSMDSVNSMDRGSMNSMNSMDRGSMNSVDQRTSRGRGVLGFSRVGDLSNVSINVIGIVCNSLDPAIRKGNSVRSTHNTSSIIGLRLLEVGLGIIISNSICVCVRRWLSQVRGSISSLCNHNRGSILGSSGGRGHKDEGKEGLHVVLLSC